MAERFLGRGDRGAMVAQAHQRQTPAAVGLAARGVQPQRLVEVAQGQPGRIGDQVGQAAQAEHAGLAGAEHQRLRIIVDRAGVVAAAGPGHAADLVDVGPGLALRQGTVARADHLVVALQVEQHHHPQAVRPVVVGRDLQGRIAGRQGLLEAPVPAQQLAAIGVVARQHGIAGLLVPDRVLQVAQGRRAMRRRLVVTLRSARPPGRDRAAASRACARSPA